MHLPPFFLGLVRDRALTCDTLWEICSYLQAPQRDQLMIALFFFFFLTADRTTNRVQTPPSHMKVLSFVRDVRTFEMTPKLIYHSLPYSATCLQRTMCSYDSPISYGGNLTWANEMKKSCSLVNDDPGSSVSRLIFLHRWYALIERRERYVAVWLETIRASSFQI